MKNNKPFVHYDAEADALSLYLSKGQEEDVREIAPGISAEFDKRGSLIGIEILNASKVLRPMFQASRRKAVAHV